MLEKNFTLFFFKNYINVIININAIFNISKIFRKTSNKLITKKKFL